MRKQYSASLVGQTSAPAIPDAGGRATTTVPSWVAGHGRHPWQRSSGMRLRLRAPLRVVWAAPPRVSPRAARLWFGALPRFHVVFACGETEEACRHALQADLERAFDAALRANRALPHFGGVFTPELADVQEAAVE